MLLTNKLDRLSQIGFFKPSMLFENKAGAYPSGALNGLPRVRLSNSPKNIGRYSLFCAIPVAKKKDL